MFEFPAIVFQDPEGRFVVTFPDLPDCIAFADALDKAPDAATAALGALLREMELVCESIPAPTDLAAIRDDPQNRDCLILLIAAPHFRRAR